ncbi:MAG: RusA family crossover junction endodeoxyribonuclease [Pseudomonadota bacterium]
MVDKHVLFLDIANLTTQRSKLRAITRDTLVAHGWRKAARYDAYDVAILLTVTSLNRRIDADNVAKALLDALTGLVWHDDRQIRRLLVEKDQAPQGAHGPAIRLRAQPHEAAGSLRAEFDAMLGH